MEIMRISSGIATLDEQTSGGFPLGSVIAYIGRPGIGKTTAGLRFIAEGLTKSEHTLVITTSSTIPQLKLQAEGTDIRIDGSKFVDGANWRLKRINPKIESHSDFEISNLTDLNALLATILQACKDDPKITRLLFDSPSSLLLYSTPGAEQVFKFFELLTAYTRSNEITMIYTLEKGIHTSAVMNSLLFISDGSIYYRYNTSNHEKRQLKISFMSLTNVFPKWLDMDEK